MPRNVRNFWIELAVDGKKMLVETGPRARSGGFNIRIRLRSRGGIHDKDFVVDGRVSDADGMLVLTAHDEKTKKTIERVEEP